MALEDLLAEVEASDWTVSWAFQFAPGHWRLSLHRETDSEDIFRHHADAPTFALALEYALIQGEEILEAKRSPTHALAPKLDLLTALGLGGKPKQPIRRV